MASGVQEPEVSRGWLAGCMWRLCAGARRHARRPDVCFWYPSALPSSTPCNRLLLCVCVCKIDTTSKGVHIAGRSTSGGAIPFAQGAKPRPQGFTAGGDRLNQVAECYVIGAVVALSTHNVIVKWYHPQKNQQNMHRNPPDLHNNSNQNSTCRLPRFDLTQHSKCTACSTKGIVSIKRWQQRKRCTRKLGREKGALISTQVNIRRHHQNSQS
eukprot:gene7052-biopygen7490